MEFLHEPEGTVHFVYNSNVYLLKNEQNGQFHMKCVMSSKCQSSIILRQNVIRSIKEHCHIPDEDKVLLIRYTKILRTRALEENTKITEIFSEFLRIHPEAANHFKSVHFVKKGMGMARYYRPSIGYACLYNEPSGKIHCTFENYIYRITRKYPLFCFARCTLAGCPGRAFIQQGTIHMTKEHSHKGSNRMMEKLKFLKELKYKSSLTKESLSRIFHIVSLNHPVGSKGIAFSALKFHMMRARLIKHASQPFVWYMPLNHTKKNATRSQLAQAQLRTSSPLSSTSLKISSPNSNTKQIKQLMQVNNDNEITKLSVKQLTCDKSIKHSSAHHSNQQHKILKFDPYVSQQQMLVNQSQILPPAQNLYVIMSPFYNPVTQKQKNELNDNSHSPPDTGIRVNTMKSDGISECKIDIKQEIVLPTSDNVIDVSDDEPVETQSSTSNSDNIMVECIKDSTTDVEINLTQDCPSVNLSDICDANVSTQTEIYGESRVQTNVVTETLLEMHNILKTLRIERNSSNEVFGKYVATSMGCMTKKNAQAARREIIDVLNKYET